MNPQYSFSEILHFLKEGKKAQRLGWNGKGMYVVLRKGHLPIKIEKEAARETGLPEGEICGFRPYIMMKTVDNEFVPWVASQTDILADDWIELDG